MVALMLEKTTQTTASRTTPMLVRAFGGALFISVICYTSFILFQDFPLRPCHDSATLSVPVLREHDFCPVFPKLKPLDDEKFVNISYFRSPEFKNHSLQVWQDAVRIYTPSYDDLGPVGEDKRWDVFYEFERYLKETFPATHKAAELEHVNTHGLVYFFKGSNENLKPILLAGHQDVVPVPEETVSRWTHSPFEGYFDGEYLWGRGSSDCKNNVISIFEAVELLFSSGFKPKRGILIALGFDEECGGKQGALEISKYLLEKFGENNIFSIIDEGGLGIQDLYGTRFALPSTGEKGYIDVQIDINTEGGHSSVPPKHTGIGIASHLVTLIESEEYPLDITPKNPYFYQLQCTAKFAKNIDPELKISLYDIFNPRSKALVLDELAKDDVTRVLVSTSRAVDIFNGGLKINALPEHVEIKVNHRVGYDSSIEEVKKTLTGYASQIAKLYGLGLSAFNETIETSDKGIIILEGGEQKNPAPQTEILNNPSWEILAGTTKHVFEDFAIYPGYDPEVSSEVIVAPSCMTGNTDTSKYWDLSDNIYRFSPIRQTSRLNAHAIDERVELDAHVEGSAFYYEFIRNADESLA